MANDVESFEKPEHGPVKVHGRGPPVGFNTTYGYIKKQLNSTDEMKLENDGRQVDNEDGLFNDPSSRFSGHFAELSINKKGRWRLAQELQDHPDDFRGPYNSLEVVKNEKWVLSRGEDRCTEFHEYTDDAERHRYAKSTYSREKALKDKPKPPRRRRRQEPENPPETEPEVSKVQYEISSGCTKKNCRARDINVIIKNNWSEKPWRSATKYMLYDQDDLSLDDNEADYESCAEYDSNDSYKEANSSFFEADLLDAIPYRRVKKPKRPKKSKKIEDEDFFSSVNLKSESEESEDSAESFEVVNIEPPTTTVNLRFMPEMPRVTLVIPDMDLDPVTLIDNFGDSYTECACIPRSFSINIDNKLKAELAASYGTQGSVTAKAQVNFLILQSNDCPVRLNSGETGVQVWINCLVADDVMSTEFNTVWEGDKFTMPEIIDRAVSCLSLLPLESFTTPSRHASGEPVSYLSAVRNLEADTTCVPRDLAAEKFMRTTLLQSLQRQLTSVQNYMSGEAGHHDQVQYCNICYTDLIPTEGAFALAACEHWFCLVCWQNYLGQQVYQGSLKILCPEFDCDSAVPSNILPHVLPQRICNVHVTQVRDFGVAGTSNGTWNWCINPHCQRLLKVEESGAANLACVCGSKWCPKCLREPHFPASCQINQLYEKQLEQHGDNVSLADRRHNVHFVSVKHCRKCSTPMEKGFGCNHMVCMCGHQFCWSCLGDWDPVKGYNDHTRCGVNSHRGFEDIFLVDVITREQLINKKSYAKCVQHRHARDPSHLKQLRLALDKKIIVKEELIKALEQKHLLSRVPVTSNGSGHTRSNIVRFLVTYYRQCHYLLEFVNVWTALNRKHDLVDMFKFRSSNVSFFVERFKEACLHSSMEKILECLGNLDHEMTLLLKGLHRLDSNEQ